MSRPSFEPCGEFFMDGVVMCRESEMRDRLEYERVQVFVLLCALVALDCV